MCSLSSRQAAVSTEQGIRAPETGPLQDVGAVFSLNPLVTLPFGPRGGKPVRSTAFLSPYFLDLEQYCYITFRSEKQFCLQCHLPPAPRTNTAPCRATPLRSPPSPEASALLEAVALGQDPSPCGGRSARCACRISLNPPPTALACRQPQGMTSCSTRSSLVPVTSQVT